MVDSRISVLESNVTAMQSWETESRRFHATVNNFMSTLNATQQATREEQARRHRTNTTKLNLLLVLASIAGVGVAIIAIFVSLSIAKHQTFEIPLTFKNSNPPALAESAHIPVL